jgi:thiosulfate/3-mercaptopyruvate sulfurtransferase
VEQGIVSLPPARFTARLNPAGVRDIASVRANIHERVEQLVDARSAGRFAGLEPEPRPGLRGGHIPGSVNLPFTDLVRSNGTLLPAEELRRRLVRAGVDLSRPVVVTCGSGTSACAVVLSLHVIGHTQASVYDGAWAEWGGRGDTPIESQIIPGS